MYISFSNKVFGEIEQLVEKVISKCELNKKTLTAKQIGNYLYNQYQFLTKSGYHVEQALDTAKRYNYQALAPVFSKSEVLTKELEKHALLDIELLRLPQKQIDTLNTAPSLAKLVRFLDQITTVDPESFLIYQYFAKALSLKLARAWDQSTRAVAPKITTEFSLISPYANMGRPEFLEGLDFIGRAIKRGSQERIMENLGMAFIKVENYILDLGETRDIQIQSSL